MISQLHKNTRHALQGHQMLICFHPGKVSPHSPSATTSLGVLVHTLRSSHARYFSERRNVQMQGPSPFPPAFLHYQSTLYCPVSFTSFPLLILNVDFNPLLIQTYLHRNERNQGGSGGVLFFLLRVVLQGVFKGILLGLEEASLLQYTSSPANLLLASSVKPESSCQWDLNLFKQFLKTTLPFLTLVTLLLATLTVLLLMPTHASCTQLPLGTP